MKPQDLHTLAAAALMPAGFRHHDSGEPAQPAAVTAAAAMAAKVDRLGAMHAAIATMKREAEQLRAEILAERERCMGKLDSHGRYWVENRSRIIDAVTAAGFRIVSDRDRCWLEPVAAAK